MPMPSAFYTARVFRLAFAGVLLLPAPLRLLCLGAQEIFAPLPPGPQRFVPPHRLYRLRCRS